MVKTLHFKTKKSYKDWLKYIYEKEIAKKHHWVKVVIKSKKYKPDHKFKK